MLYNTYDIIDNIKIFIDKLIPVMFGLAVLFFFWGIVKYIWSVGAGKEQGKRIMFWGVIALFVMTSVWGLVKFIGDSFGIQEKTPAGKIPTVRTK